MSQPIGIGVIGMGWMGMVHSRAYRQVADRFPDLGLWPKLVICADDVAERAAQAQSRLGFRASTDEWRQVVNHPDVQVINIAAPNFMHLEMVREAAATGKHVFCEKPVGRTPEETAEMEYLVRRAGVLSFVGFNYRWAPMVQYAKQLIEEGKLGRLTHYRGRFFSMYGSNPLSRLSWRFQDEMAGLGVLGDLMSHVGDMAHMLVGPVRRVVSNRHTFISTRPLPTSGAGTHFSLGSPDDPTGPVTNEDYASILVEFDNGVQGALEACRVIYGPKCEMAFEVHGTNGALRWNFERMNELELYLPDGQLVHDGYTKLLGGPAVPLHAYFNPGDGIGIGYEDLKIIEAYQFLQSIAQGQQRTPGFRDALQLANLQSAVQRSWHSASWETVNSLEYI